MHDHVENVQDNKTQEVYSNDSQNQIGQDQSASFLDSRPGTIFQRKLQENANNGSQISQLISFQNLANTSQQSSKLIQLQSVADHYSIKQTQTIQKKENNTGLPDNLKSGIENLSGYSMDDVKVHYNSQKPAQLQAHAYAQGTDIHLGPGQEKHLPHEAWHVVQQKQDRVKPTMQMKEKINVNDDAGLEKEADIMGAKAENLSYQNTSLSETKPVIQSKTHQLVKIHPSEVDPSKLQTSPAGKSAPVDVPSELQTSPADKSFAVSTEEQVREILAEKLTFTRYTHGLVLFKLGIGEKIGINERYKYGISESQFEEDKKLRIDHLRKGSVSTNLKQNWEAEAEKLKLEYEKNGKNGSPPPSAEQLKNYAIAKEVESDDSTLKSEDSSLDEPKEGKEAKPRFLEKVKENSMQIKDKGYSVAEKGEEYGGLADEWKGIIEEQIPDETEENLNLVAENLLQAGSSREEVRGVIDGEVEIEKSFIENAFDWMSPVLNNMKLMLGLSDLVTAFKTKGKDKKLEKKDKAKQGVEKTAEAVSANAEYIFDSENIKKFMDFDPTGSLPMVSSTIKIAIASINGMFDFSDQLSLANFKPRSEKAKPWVSHIQNRLMMRQGANLLKGSLAALGLASSILAFLVETITTGSPGLATAATVFLFAQGIGSLSTLITKYYMKKKVKEKIQIVKAEQIDEANYYTKYVKIDGKMISLIKAEVAVGSEVDELLETIKTEVSKNENEGVVNLEKQTKSDKTVKEIETTYKSGEKKKITAPNRKEMSLIELAEDESPSGLFIDNRYSINSVFTTPDKGMIVIYYEVSDAKNILNALHIPTSESGKFNILRRKLLVVERL